MQRERHAPDKQQQKTSVITKQTLISLHPLVALSRNALLLLRYNYPLYVVQHDLSMAWQSPCHATPIHIGTF